jgi:hypothetical protein
MSAEANGDDHGHDRQVEIVERPRLYQGHFTVDCLTLLPHGIQCAHEESPNEDAC